MGQGAAVVEGEPVSLETGEKLKLSCAAEPLHNEKGLGSGGWAGCGFVVWVVAESEKPSVTHVSLPCRATPVLRGVSATDARRSVPSACPWSAQPAAPCPVQFTCVVSFRVVAVLVPSVFCSLGCQLVRLGSFVCVRPPWCPSARCPPTARASCPAVLCRPREANAREKESFFLCAHAAVHWQTKTKREPIGSRVGRLSAPSCANSLCAWHTDRPPAGRKETKSA